MRLAYLDAFAGLSGDMFLGALIQAGVPADVLRENLEQLELGATLEIRETERRGIRALKVDVRVGGELAETAPAAGAANGAGSPRHAHEPGHDHDHHQDHDHHAGGRPHAATPHRSLPEIRALIGRARLREPVARLALRTFELLGRAEAKVHGISLEAVHFHEVGAVDAIADIVLAAAGAHALNVDAWHCSPLNVGGGTVECQHGRFPVPAPATAELLRGAPTYSSGLQAELVTPTGAALVRALGCRFGPQPALSVEHIGYGAGTRDPGELPNVLRLSIGTGADPVAASGALVSVIETAVDDLNPQIIGYVAETALALGALDVVCTPVQMKKNRPGTLITILAEPDKAALFEDLLLRETSSLGLRIRQERRICLAREWVSVATEWGAVRVKVARRDGAEWNAAPEFEDCRKLAQERGVPLKRVMEAALQAYRASSGTTPGLRETRASA